MPRPHPLVIAHRGASGYRPEHSRGAYELALRLGADAIEPDLVPTRDGVLVIRHESEISGTTDVAEHPEFAARRTTKEVEGHRVTGWFTEDFDWAELATLRVRERLPRVRPHNATFDDRWPLLRLEDALAILDAHADAAGTRPALVAELKHPTHFASLGFPLAELFAAAIAGADGRDRLIVECFEESALHDVRARGVAARYTYLLEADGAAADLVARSGGAATPYADQLTAAGLDELVGRVDGVSLDRSILARDPAVVGRVHERALEVFVWTLRAENRFLAPEFRRGGPGAKAEWGDWAGDFGRLLALGVDGVFADQPDLALLLREAGGGGVWTPTAVGGGS